MKKVTAYQVEDGTLFIEKSDAEQYESVHQGQFIRKRIFNEKQSFITEYIKENFKDEIRGDKVTFWNEGEWGWDCDNRKENPIDKCIYSYSLPMGDDCCVFCGQPEERK